jgi:hypothetical protein
MADPATPEPAAQPKIVKIGRATIALNVVTQFLVFLALVGMVNYLGFRHFKRWDFSREKKYALASQTKSVLASLAKPVKAVIFFSGANEIHGDVQALLREYEYASDRKFNVEVVDQFRNITRAQDLQVKYKFGASENIVILDYDGRSKFVNASDMAEVEMPDRMEQMMGQEPKLKAFKGEQAITTTLVELVENKPNKLYYLTGHQEAELEGDEMKVFGEAIKRQNIQVVPLTLLNEANIPADASGIILNAPKYDLSELELELLGQYFEKKGRVLVMLNPTIKTPRLDGWLAKRGIVPQGDRIIKVGKSLVQDEEGNIDVKTGPITNPAYNVVGGGSKLTKDLEGASAQFLGPAQSLTFDRTKEQTDKIRFTPLIQSAEGYWGETEFVSDTLTPFFDPNKDSIGPLTVAASAEKGGVADSRVKVETSRLVVVGNGELPTNKSHRLSEGLSTNFAMNTLNWLLDREAMIGIAAKEKRQTTMTLNELEMNRLKTFVLLIVPGLAAFCGIMNWWARRS